MNTNNNNAAQPTYSVTAASPNSLGWTMVSVQCVNGARVGEEVVPMRQVSDADTANEATLAVLLACYQAACNAGVGRAACATMVTMIAELEASI